MNDGDVCDGDVCVSVSAWMMVSVQDCKEQRVATLLSIAAYLLAMGIVL